MKRAIFTCLLAILVVGSVMLAGCTGEKRIVSPSAVPTPVNQQVTVPYGKEIPVTIDAPATSEVYLTMTARADAKELSGGRSFMRLKVNGKEITPDRLVNKNLNFTYGDGFKTSYYSTNMSAWYLFFSPDFIGYDNPKLADHILEGNAYVYKFDVSDLVNKGSPNEVLIENIGDEVAAEYSNPKDIEFYKSAAIVINPLRLEGKGTDVVRLVKEVSPARIVTGKKTTVTLTIYNDLPESITDVEIADADIPSGLSGKAVTGRVDKPVAAGETYTVTYEVTADKAGTYPLGPATVTFADSTGNYQKLSSGTATITVI